MGEQQGTGQGEAKMDPRVSEANRAPVITPSAQWPQKIQEFPSTTFTGNFLLERKWTETKWLCSGQARVPSCHYYLS